MSALYYYWNYES